MVLMTSRLISARISVERMFASSASAFRPWIALRSCASSKEYSSFECSGLSSNGDLLDRECHLVEMRFQNRRQDSQRRLYSCPDLRCRWNQFERFWVKETRVEPVCAVVPIPTAPLVIPSVLSKSVS